MTSTTYRGVVHGGVVLLDEAPPLTDGTEVLVTPAPATFGSGAAIVAALDAAPKVPAEWVDELDRAIAAGRRPPSLPASFTEEAGSGRNG